MMSTSKHLSTGNPSPVPIDVQDADHPITTWFSQFEADKTSRSAGELCHYVVNEMDHKDNWSPDLSQLMTRAASFLGFGVAEWWVNNEQLSPK